MKRILGLLIATAIKRSLHPDERPMAKYGGTLLPGLTQNQFKRCIFPDLEELIMEVESNIDGHNQNPKPFI